MKRIISILLIAVMICGLSCTAVSADGVGQERVYNYVALGDSVAAGFGLENDSLTPAEDPALFLTEELIADPIREAYPAVFGENAAEWGRQRGYTVNTTNLSCCAYRAEDVAGAILEEGYTGAVAEKLVRTFIEPEDDPFVNYHDLYVKYLKDADLISIQLGANDIIMGVIEPMYSEGNPVLEAIGVTVTMMIIGADSATAVAAGGKTLSDNRKKITYKSFTDAVDYMKSFFKRAEECVDTAAANVGKVIDAVRTVNSDADIAVLGLFNPYGDPADMSGVMSQVKDVVSELMVSGAQEILGMGGLLGKLIADSLIGSLGSDEALFSMAAESIDGLVLSLNSQLKIVAEDAGAVYVDVYGISSEMDLDPHPDAQRHSEIAQRLTDAMYPIVIKRMAAQADEPAAICGDSDGDGEVTVIDATAIQRVLAGLPVETFVEQAADTDGDGVNILDATSIQRWLAGLSAPENINKAI